MIHHFDHRFATYDSETTIRNTLPEERLDPLFVPLPRYWVSEEAVEARLEKRDAVGKVIWKWTQPWLLGFRDITNATNERTAIFAIIPKSGVGHTMPICMFDNQSLPHAQVFTASVSSYVFDYVARQFVGGTHLTYFILKQLPVPAPSCFEPSEVAWISQLTAMIQGGKLGTAKLPSMGSSESFRIPECATEAMVLLDAYFFRKFGLSVEEADYVLESFSGWKHRATGMKGRTKGHILYALESESWLDRAPITRSDSDSRTVH